MCGICGVIQVGGRARRVVEPHVLDRMTEAIVHRGPDDSGTYTSSGVALGARRLSIVDVGGGHQPFANEDGSVWAVQNGELYNHAAVRHELARDGHRLVSRCDTEILPHLYERDGEGFASALRGMFAVAVWDDARKRGVLVRDRLGVKPLYYARVGDLLVFASELKSLLASGLIEPELDYTAVEAYLVLGYFPAPRTPLAGVSKLLPGHRLVVGDGDVKLERYWSYPHPAPAPDGRTMSGHAQELLERLEDSVRMRLMSDVPLGAMLSGGLDSSLIVALMARNMSEPVKTFSVGFAEAGDANELGDARSVAEALGADHFELELSVHERVIDLEDLVWSLDEPLADLSALGFHALSELAARHVTVALSGQGADELFGGYPKHRAAAAIAPILGLPGAVRRPALALARHGPSSLRRLADAAESVDPVQRLLAMSGQLDDGLRGALARGQLARVGGSAAADAIAPFLDGVEADALSTTLFLDAQLALADDMLHYFDRASMAHSLEVRVPFLDHEFVEYAATVPPQLKATRLETKRVLKRAARGLVPDRVIDKRKIGFFSVSVDLWLREQTEGVIAERLLGRNPRSAEFLDRDAVAALVARSRTGGPKSREVRLVLAILMLEIWLAEFLPRALRPAAHERDAVRLAV